MKFAILLAISTLMTSAAFAHTATVTGDVDLSRSESLPWSSESQSSGLVAYKQILNAAQPDAQAVLMGEEATPMFLKAVEVVEAVEHVRFESQEEAAIAIIESNSNE